MPDTTSNRSKAAAFHKNNSYLQRLADLSPNPLFVIDLNEQKIIYINEKAKELLRYEAGYVYDRGPENL